MVAIGAAAITNLLNVGHTTTFIATVAAIGIGIDAGDQSEDSKCNLLLEETGLVSYPDIQVQDCLPGTSC